MQYIVVGILVLVLVFGAAFAYAEAITSEVEAAEAYQIRIEADSAAAKAAEQLRHEQELNSYNETRKQQWLDMWASWGEDIKSVGRFAIRTLYLPVISFVLGLIILAFSVPYTGARAFNEWTMIRARIIPQQADGTLPAFIIPTSEALPMGEKMPTGWKSWTHFLQYRPNRLMFMDAATGRTQLLNTEHPTCMEELEVVRQLRLRYLVMNAMGKTALLSKNGAVASAMSQVVLEDMDGVEVLPDPTDSPKVRDFVKEVMSEIRQKES